MAQRGGDGRTYERTYGQKISPFYRTLSPIGAAAQKQTFKKDILLYTINVSECLYVPLRKCIPVSLSHMMAVLKRPYMTLRKRQFWKKNLLYGINVTIPVSLNHFETPVYKSLETRI